MAAKKKNNNESCEFCGEEIHSKYLEEIGNNIGNGGTLGQRIMEFKYSPGKTAQDHPLSMPQRSKYSFAQAHHLISSEVLCTEEWSQICSIFGYDINCKENGVFFPADMRVACELKIPLHRGNHSQTQTEETPDYVGVVTSLVMPVLEAAQQGKYCDKKGALIKKMNNISKEIWSYVKDFDWILTYDGSDYNSGGIGCLGVRSLPKKREIEDAGNVKKCPKGRNHGIGLRKSTFFKEQ